MIFKTNNKLKASVQAKSNIKKLPNFEGLAAWIGFMEEGKCDGRSALLQKEKRMNGRGKCG